jgi:hypothetical protein
MKELLIKHPFFLKMDVLENEEYLPSSRMSLNLKLTHSAGEYSYTANNIWFDATTWANFIASLERILAFEDTQAILHDMSELFSMIVESVDYEFKLTIACKEPIVGNRNSVIVLTTEMRLDFEKTSSIYKSFME